MTNEKKVKTIFLSSEISYFIFNNFSFCQKWIILRFICPFVCLCALLCLLSSVCMSVCQSGFVYQSMCLSVCLSACLHAVSVCFSDDIVSLSACLFVGLCFSIDLCFSMLCLSICLSTSLSVYVLFGLSKERPILDHHAKAHIHEIRRILYGFYEIWQISGEIWWISYADFR